MGEGGRLFEATFSDRGVRVYPMDARGEPVSAAGLGGTVYLRGRRGRRKQLSLQVRGDAGAAGFLEAASDLSAIRDGSRTAMFSLRGFDDGDGRASGWTRFVRTRREAGRAQPGPTPAGQGHPHGAAGHSHGSGGHSH